MTHNILYIRHSGSSLFGNANATRQHDHPMVATTAICGSYRVCFGCFRGLPPASLPIFVGSAKQSPIATHPRTQRGVHGQSSAPAYPSGAKPVSSARSAHQPGGHPGIGAVAGSAFSQWLRKNLERVCHASFNTERIVMLQPSWRRSINYWCRWRPQAAGS